MDIPSKFYRVSVKAVMRDEDGRILLVQERSDKWSLPGGGLEFGETIEEGLRREVQEELGVSIKSWNAQPLAAWPSQNAKKTCYCFVVAYSVVPSSENFVVTDEIRAFRYFSVNEIATVELDEADKGVVDFLWRSIQASN